MKTSKKIIAVFLSILTILSVMSTAFPVFAQFTTGHAEDIEETFDLKIIDEKYEERDEFSKTFLMSDGSFQKAVYMQPIHYRDGDEWLDYDNSLTEQPTDDNERDIFEQNTVYKTNNKNANFVFAKKSNAKNLVSYTDETYPISWNFQSAKNSKIQIMNNNDTFDGDEKFLKLRNINNEVVYKNIFNNVDVKYKINTDGIKEDIILNDQDSKTSFTIIYNIGRLSATKVDSKTIELTDDNNVVIYRISAPYMYDANGEKSEAISFQIKKNHNGMLDLTISANQAWLKSPERKYPVTIDPSVLTENKTDIDATYVSSKNSNENYSDYETVRVGSGSEEYGTTYTLIKIKNVRADGFGDHIVSAKLQLPLSELPSQSATAYLYQVNEAWDNDTVTWNNAPGSSNIIADYFNVSPSSKTMDFDITKIYNQWIENYLTEGVNDSNGLAIKINDSQTVALKKNNSEAPILTVKYISTVGIDEDFSYTQFDMGSAGSVYINNLSGNLVIQRDDISSTGEYEPIDMSSTYNSYGGISNNLEGISSWRTNDQYGFSIMSLYMCEDGSARVFDLKESNEDGTVTLAENEFGWEKIKATKFKTFTIPMPKPFNPITMKIPINFDAWKNNGADKYSFDMSGLKKKVINIEDGNAEPDTPKGGETVFEREYSYDSSGNQIETEYRVIDGSGDKILIKAIDHAKIIKQIDVLPDGTNTERASVTYVYNDDGNVTQIKHNDDIAASFTYDSNLRMTSIADDSGHKITFTYGEKSLRIASVQESYSGTDGQKISFENRSYNSVCLRASGADSVYGNNDDVLTTYSFDSAAKCIAERSETVGGDDLGAVSYEYSNRANDATSSPISKVSAVGKNTENLLKNHNLESTDNWTARYIDDNKATYTADFSTEKAYIGKGSLRVKVNSITKTGGAAFYQNFMLSDGLIKAGKTYTASAYINASTMKKQSVAETEKNYGAAILARIEKADGSSIRLYSQNIHSTDTNVDNGWERVHVTFDIPEDATKFTMYLVVRNATGTAYFDAVQLEEGSTLSQYNMLENNAFIYSDSKNYATNWKRNNLTTSDVVVNGRMKVTGNLKTNTGVYQDVYLENGVDPETTYIISGWSQANSVPRVSPRSYLLYATIYYKEKDSNGTQYTYQQIKVHYNYDITDKQFVCGAFKLKHPTIDGLTPERIRIAACYYKEANSVFFDSLSLVKSNNVYDASQENEDADNSENTAYTYDDNGNILTYTDENGVVYTYQYDNMGNLVSSLNPNGKGDRYTYAYYDLDNDGKSDKSVCLTESHEDGSSNVYTYDSNWNLISETNTSDGTTTVLTYNSDGLLLTESATPGKSYTYTYDSMNNVLTKLTDDGIGDRYSYTYIDTDGDGESDKSLVASENLEDGTSNSYTYDAKGNLIKETASKDGKSLTYSYNASGQITSVEHNGF
ncbi:MAG: DNRLRE domain-containing protein, partial [Ruminococcus sp.]|nr:DNRLRE domain-containing protein [Ruminococcus sp.]